MIENLSAFSFDQITIQFPEENIVDMEESALYDDQQLETYLLDHLNTNISVREKSQKTRHKGNLLNKTKKRHFPVG